MHLSRCLNLVAIATLPCAPALAQSLPFGLQPEGHFSLGYTNRTPGAEMFLFGDANLRLGFDSFASGVPLGLELGLFGLATGLDTPHETYGALTWDPASGGRILIGVPRPAYDSFAVSAIERHFPTLSASTAPPRPVA